MSEDASNTGRPEAAVRGAEVDSAHGSSAGPGVRVADLEFAYRRTSFQLRVPRWEVAAAKHVAVTGPSGSGKTTLLHLLAGIFLPDAGAIDVTGVRVDMLTDAQRRRFRLERIGFVFQDFRLLEYLDVVDNIVLPYRIGRSRRRNSDLRERAAALAEAVGIGDRLRRNVQRLSHGERQRVALCRALIGEPELILADEPTGNLDPRNKHQIMELLHEHARRLQATLIVVTHDTGLVSEMDSVVDFKDWMGV